MKAMVGGCCVCSDERGWAENPLVYCDGHLCNVAVHQGKTTRDFYTYRLQPSSVLLSILHFVLPDYFICILFHLQRVMVSWRCLLDRGFVGNVSHKKELLAW